MHLVHPDHQGRQFTVDPYGGGIVADRSAQIQLLIRTARTFAFTDRLALLWDRLCVLLDDIRLQQARWRWWSARPGS